MNSTKIRKASIAITVAAAVAAPLAGTGTAFASHGGATATVASGSCSGSADWRLKAKPDDNLIEVEWEVDAVHPGQQWSVRIRDNGDSVYSGTRTTKAPSDSFTVHRKISNAAGDDVITVRSRHGKQVCKGSVTI